MHAPTHTLPAWGKSNILHGLTLARTDTSSHLLSFLLDSNTVLASDFSSQGPCITVLLFGFFCFPSEIILLDKGVRTLYLYGPFHENVIVKRELKVTRLMTQNVRSFQSNVWEQHSTSH